MGYDLYWHNLSEEDHEELASLGKAAMEEAHEAGEDPLVVAGILFRAQEVRGTYFRAGVHKMHALREELRHQGADALARSLDWEAPREVPFDPYIPPSLILKELREVKAVPTHPPDHEYVDPFEQHMTAVMEASGKSGDVTATTDRAVLVAMSDGDWAMLWHKFLAFLLAAAYYGDGVDVT